MVRLDASDLWSERRYSPFRAYAFSKHAVQGFHLELARRLAAAGDSRASLLAHPGWATNAYAARRPGITDRDPRGGRIFETATGWVGQGKDRGAWPAVRAVTDPDAVNGMYFGPSRMLAGPPVPVRPVASSASPDFGAALWADAEEKTTIRFPL
jgi:NAD(P)-dependent dehydrogenase (short-subunit alcohol dehydrogenase family)